MNVNDNILETINNFLEETFKLESKIIILPFLDQECPTLLNRLFALIYFEDQFHLSFCLNHSTIFEVCFFTNELSLILNQHLVPYVEYFIDQKENMLYFGNEAHNRNSDHINTLKGIKLCPICDKYLPLQMFNDDNGFCAICNKITLNLVTFH